MNKIISVEHTLSFLKDGMTVMIGGFLANGTPEKIVDTIAASGIKNLTLICNDTAFPERGFGKLFVNKQVSKVITSYIGANPVCGEQLDAGELQVEFVPQGTLAERLRAAGCGLGGILTPTGLGTLIAQGKQIVNVDGKDYLLEKPLRADVALICASVGDKSGNLVYRGTSQNFNPLMAMAADVVIAEVGELVETGTIPPENIKTQGILVDYLVN
ncbi:MAG: CoA transferase subunit A [Prevotellaceae bacterium]|jgi:acetate CoA/acetoacetate CoA-transferase alpha subunit|nr:CoA transferase subunit A [Prevotellaceae bacterium]